jgi:hypothetical protein
MKWKKMGKRRKGEKGNDEKEGWKRRGRKKRRKSGGEEGAGHEKQTSLVSTCD